MSTLAQNKRALYDYQILEKFQAGLVLTGAEVKSTKASRANLQGSYVLPRGNELWLTGASIAAYPPAAREQISYDPNRDRKLLLKAQEISYLIGKLKEKGLTVVPISIYTAHRLVKVELGVAKGKKTHDKRKVIKQRQLDREVRSSLKY